jgi:hypothetical protein
MSQNMGGADWMQTSVPNDSENAGGSGSDGSSTNQSFGTFVVFVIACTAGSIAILLFAIFLRELYWRTCGANKWHGDRRDARLESDRALAEEIQRRFNEDEEQRIIKENERRAWYESYMKKFTMVRDSLNITVL